MNNLNNLIGFIDDVNSVGRRRLQQYKDDPNYYNILGDDEFIYRFRLSKTCVDYLLTLLAEKLETATDSRERMSCSVGKPDRMERERLSNLQLDKLV